MGGSWREQIMSFMASNEFLLLLDAQPFWSLWYPYYLTLQNKMDLREAGIQTVHGELYWPRSEPVRGEYDFSDFDRLLRINRAAGMKTKVNIPGGVPAWMSDEWMLKKEDGSTKAGERKMPIRFISFWNEEAQEYCENYLKDVIERYHAPDVLFNYGEFQDGEGMLPCAPFFYDDFAVMDYKEKYGSKAYPNINTQETRDWLQVAVIKRVIRAYKIINKHNEIWNHQQLLMDDFAKTYVNYAQKDIMRACKKTFPNSNLVLEQDTYWDGAHTERHRNYVDEIKEEFQCDVIVEAMWPQGLPITTPASIAKGYRGQVIGVSAQSILPIHSLESWILNNIKEAHNQWLRSSQ